MILSRRSVFGVVAGALAKNVSRGDLKKFYITGFGDDCKVPPLVAYGKDRIDALVNSQVTVWTEEEFKELSSLGNRKEFEEACKVLEAGK